MARRALLGSVAVTALALTSLALAATGPSTPRAQQR
jgi:hypothetical protein